MTTYQAKALIESEPDFIYSRRHNYSLAELQLRYPEGCPDRILAAVLLMTEDDVESRYQVILKKLQAHMGVTKDSL